MEKEGHRPRDGGSHSLVHAGMIGCELPVEELSFHKSRHHYEAEHQHVDASEYFVDHGRFFHTEH